MEPLLRIGVFVQGRAVEAAEGMPVGREVGRHPIDQYADARLMAVVDEVHEVVRRAEPTGGGEVTGRLVTPGTLEGVFGQRHQLQMRVTHLMSVVDKLMGQFAVVEVTPPIFRTLPASQMHFVSCHRPGEPIDAFTVRDPGFVVPGEAA